MENMDDQPKWKGTHKSKFKSSLNGPLDPEVIPGDDHTVLIRIFKDHASVNRIPECYPSIFNKVDHWDERHVKLPCSQKNITQDQINRWSIIRDVLNSPILSSQQFEDAVLSYNRRYIGQWKFSALHLYFETLEDSERTVFFSSLLPKIIDLALRLPELITYRIPLLRRGRKHSITLSQLQTACLLANAFLCTFPHRNSVRRNSEYGDYPDINFNKLFQCDKISREKAVQEKLKCIINYFRRVTNSTPRGVITFSRQLLTHITQPQWVSSKKSLCRLYVSSVGTIEDEGFGFFQVDFANKFVGGGVLGSGCVQEEIRFVICPELILSRLFTQSLGENEALIVTGCERYNMYKGYGHTFEWTGNFIDETPMDKYGRKYCTVIALDALQYQRNPHAQYLPKNILRDLNKAFCGFSWGIQKRKEELCAVATGNWGCGAFRGDPELKSLLQLVAAAEVGRDLVYFTFGDEELRDSLYSVHEFLSDNNIHLGKIYNLLHQYGTKQMFNTIKLFDYLKNEATQYNPFTDEGTSDSSSLFKSFDKPKLAITKRSFCYRKKQLVTDDTLSNGTNLSESLLMQSDNEDDDFENVTKKDTPTEYSLTAHEQSQMKQESKFYLDFYSPQNISDSPESLKKNTPMHSSMPSFDQLEKFRNSIKKMKLNKSRLTNKLKKSNEIVANNHLNGENKDNLNSMSNSFETIKQNEIIQNNKIEIKKSYTCEDNETDERNLLLEIESNSEDRKILEEKNENSDTEAKFSVNETEEYLLKYDCRLANQDLVSNVEEEKSFSNTNNRNKMSIENQNLEDVKYEKENILKQEINNKDYGSRSKLLHSKRFSCESKSTDKLSSEKLESDSKNIFKKRKISDYFSPTNKRSHSSL